MPASGVSIDTRSPDPNIIGLLFWQGCRRKYMYCQVPRCEHAKATSQTPMLRFVQPHVNFARA